MAAGNAIRGTRVGSGPCAGPNAVNRPPAAASPTGAPTGTRPSPPSPPSHAPATWDCPRCGLPAGQDEQAPPARPRTEPYKTHLAYVKERRTEEDGEAILAEALHAFAPAAANNARPGQRARHGTRAAGGS